MAGLPIKAYRKLLTYSRKSTLAGEYFSVKNSKRKTVYTKAVRAPTSDDCHQLGCTLESFTKRLMSLENLDSINANMIFSLNYSLNVYFMLRVAALGINAK